MKAPLLLLALAAGGYYVYRQQGTNGMFDLLGPDDTGEEAPDPTFSLLDYVSAIGEPDVIPADDTIYARRMAFLKTIQTTEGTINQPDPYLTLYSYATWEGVSYTDHPANMGWPGVRLSDDMCRHAGLNPPCKSTAAGAYQNIKPTWNRLAAKLNLVDFSPASQDEAALELIREKGALSLVDQGDVLGATARVASLWASLPGSTAQQNPATAEKIAAIYQSQLAAYGLA